MVRQTESAADLAQRVQQMARQLSPAERQASHQLLESYEDLPFLTADAIGRQANVSASTVTRLVSKLGYGGFPDLQAEAQSRLKQRLSSIERVRKVGHRRAREVFGLTFESPSLEQDVRLLLRFAENIVLDDIRAAASLILGSQAILVVGFRAAAPLAYFLHLGLAQLLGPQVRLAGDSMLLPEYVEALSEKDALIAISFPRYSSHTIETASVCRRRGVKVVAVTNSVLSPLAGSADIVLTCPFAGRAFQNSMIAAHALANVLIEQIITLMSRDARREMERRLSRTEELIKSWRWLREIGDNNSAE